jgi:hypothetical protein
MVLGPDLEPASHAIPMRLLEMQPEQAHERALAFQLRSDGHRSGAVTLHALQPKAGHLPATLGQDHASLTQPYQGVLSSITS